MLVSLPAFIGAAVLVVYAPSFLLPAWYAEERRRSRAGLEPAIPPPPEGPVPTMTRRQLWLSIALLVAFSVMALAMRLSPQSLLVGLGVGIPR